jgi:hypothetical protein
MQDLDLKALLLKITAQSSEELKRSQQSLRLLASLRVMKDLRPRPPWEYGLQTFFQATVTIFL